MSLSRLPDASGARHIKAFRRLGFRKDRHGGTSHVALKHPDGRMCILPMHRPTVKRTTLAGALEQAGISIDDYLAAFRKRGSGSRG